MRFKQIAIALLGAALMVPQIARADDARVCKVTDPTGTPLNVRDNPNGRVINALKNGREVYIEQIAYEEHGRSWAKLSGYYNGSYRSWGWVIREFVSCYKT